VTGASSQPYLLGEVGEAAPPSVDVVGGFVSGTGRGTGLAIGGGGGGGNIGVGRKGLCTLPWLLPLGCEGGEKTKHTQEKRRNICQPLAASENKRFNRHLLCKLPSILTA
jgi:hypothetical protein